MPRPEGFGYSFSEHEYSGTVLLDWTVAAQLWAVDGTGTAFRQVDHDELRIGRLSAARQPRIELQPELGKRGFYRFDMQITDRTGKVLGSYSAYFKVVRPSWQVRLGLTRDKVRPGQRILGRLENYGSETVEYGEPFGVQRFEQGRWVSQPDLSPQGWLMWAGFLGPGGTGLCNALNLPPDTRPGRYRLVKGVEPGPRGASSILTAPFEVAG
jgi:hypothetical protein